MKKYTDRKRAEVDNYKVGDLVLLSTKDLKYQIIGRRIEKLIKRFVGSYKIKKIVLSNMIELELPSIVRIHLVLCCQRIFCKNVAWNTNYTPRFHYCNLLQKSPISPRHNLDPRLGTSIRQWPSYHILEQHIPWEARLINQHQVSQIQTINVKTLEIRGLEISLKYKIILIQSRLRLI